MKRAFDMALSFVALVLLSPVLGVIALGIALEGDGPVLFKQTRVGRDGRDFTIFKFRTMRPGSENRPDDLPLEAHDPMITKIGSVLRAWSLDELPQLVNILKGDMSVVGPRPTIREQVEQYDDFQRRRLEVRPGLTGWAQVNGRNSLSWEERIRYDVWYVDNRNLLLDLGILVRTVAVVLQPSLVWDPSSNSEQADGLAG